MIHLSDYIAKERIVFMEAHSKDEALKKLINIASENENVTDNQKFEAEVLEREKLLSTGIGKGVAIPHVKSEFVKDFFITIGINKEPIEWNSIDGKPVRLIFLIAGPDEHKKYLRLMSRLLLYVKNQKHLDDILNAKTPDEVYDILIGA